MSFVLTKPGTATAFPLRLRLHYKAARAGGVRRIFFFVMDYESNMEVGLAAPNLLFVPARPCRLREGEARAGCRPSHAEAAAFESCKRVSRQLCSHLGVLAALAEVARVARSFAAGFCVQHVAPLLASNLSKSVSPNKALKLARVARWDALSARPLTNR